jgi:eukaryotic-like serine/threonine-protein kinase
VSVEIEGDWNTVTFGGLVLQSPTVPGVSYRLQHRIGHGGGSTAFVAQRCHGSEATSVVVKLMRPEWLSGAAPQALLAYQKEVGALARLEEGAPGTRFVVRLIDTGRVTVRTAGSQLDLPWLALEYVDGGELGTTLKERVDHSLRTTRAAFPAWRAARAIHCMAWGLYAVHQLRVVHRDLSPSNVLCSGQGADEEFKIADFGLARDPAASGTFGGTLFGTIGYVAPEQFEHKGKIGPWSDIFSVGAIAFFLLTGTTYLSSNTLPGMMLATRRPERPALLDAPALSPDLRAHPDVCRAVDAVLARATQAQGSERHGSIGEFARELLGPLREITQQTS